MRHSLRLRLTLAVIGATGPLMALFAFLLYRAVSGAVWESFDRELADDARVMADLVEFDAGGYDTEELAAMAARFAADPHVATHYQIWHDDSPLLTAATGSDALAPVGAPMDAPLWWNATLAGGHEVRFVGFRFVPRVDEEEVDGSAVDSLSITLGRDTRRIETLLADLLAWFVMLGTGMVLVASGVAGFAVARGVKPMVRIARELGAVDEDHLDRPLTTDTIPIELRPMVDRLNALLSRLDAAFARERQFSSDVAHELRTPLSVLRASVELSMREPTLPAPSRLRLQDMLETIDQTVCLVDDLLELARSEATASDLPTDAVDLRDLVDRQWRALEPTASARSLRFRNAIPPATYVESDPDALRRIASNLLSNAVSYTEDAGWIEVHSRPDAGVVLEVRDSGPPIPDAHLPRLFDRLWRADAARTAAGHHAGLGLALVRTLASRLGCTVHVRNVGREVAFSIHQPPPTKEQSDA